MSVHFIQFIKPSGKLKEEMKMKFTKKTAVAAILRAMLFTGVFFASVPLFAASANLNSQEEVNFAETAQK